MANKNKTPLEPIQPAAAMENTGAPAVSESSYEETAAVPGPDDIIFMEKKRFLFLGLPWTLTKYIITPSMVTIDTGLFNVTENDCYLYKIADVKLTVSFWEKLVGIGTVHCYTSDNTDPSLHLVHVKHAKEIKNYLLKQSEVARIQRRTYATQDISARGFDMDHNGIPDWME